MESFPYQTSPSSSKVISRGHKDRQTGDLISLLSFLESRLIKCCCSSLYISYMKDTQATFYVTKGGLEAKYSIYANSKQVLQQHG
jgi:hypothetical protein